MAYKKLVLFDIDGTLIVSNSLGAKALMKAVQLMYGHDINYNIPFAGMTDSFIILNMIDHHLKPEEKCMAHIQPVFQQYLTFLEETYFPENGAYLLPGVRELVEACHKHSDIGLALLTGNIQRGAYRKIGAFGLDKYFAFGAFGDDDIQRSNLPEVAVQRAKEHFGQEFREKDIVIIGDTIHDVRCGRHLNVKTIAVCTRKDTRQALLDENPDYLMDDFLDTQAVIKAILE